MDATIWNETQEFSYTKRYVDAGGWRTRVLTAGEENPGDPIILLHGTGGHIEAYSRNVGPLSQDRRVITFDFPGHGYSTPATSDLEMPVYVEHLLAFLDVLGVGKAILCGESLGGWVAVKFTAAHPDRVSRLILNTPGGTMATREVMERLRSLSQAAADDPTPERIRTRLEWLMADNASVTDELVETRRRIYSQPHFPRSMKHILCLQDLEIRTRNLITDEELRSIAAPTMVVWTSDDPSGPAAAGMDMAQKVQDGKFELIEGAGHWPQWEQADRFNALVSEFAQRD